MANKLLPFMVINPNDHSLCPKINSMVDCFTEMEASVAIVTETWLTDGDSLQEDLEHLVLGSGIRLLCRNWDVNNRGFSHGGVCVAFREFTTSLKVFKLHNPMKFEVLACSRRMQGCGRKLVVIAAYIPPNYVVGRGKAPLEFVAGAVPEVKRGFDKPLVVVGGNFNQWDIA